MSLLLHGFLICACVIAIFPVFWILISSFKPQQRDHQLADAQHPAGSLAALELHARPHGRQPHLPDWFWNSLVVAFLTTIIGVFLAATAAYAFSRYRFPGYRPALTRS